jgi:hypothetical protein
MKKFVSPIFAFALVATIFFSACKKDNNTAPANTNPNGTSANFVGNWFNTENGSFSGTQTYNVAISSTNASTILFSNLYNQFTTKVTGTVINNNFTINNQIIEGYNVYYVDNGLGTDTLTSVLTR